MTLPEDDPDADAGADGAEAAADRNAESFPDGSEREDGCKHVSELLLG